MKNTIRNGYMGQPDPIISRYDWNPTEAERRLLEAEAKAAGRQNLTDKGRIALARYAAAEDGTLAVSPCTETVLKPLIRAGYLRKFGEYDQWQITADGRAALPAGGHESPHRNRHGTICTSNREKRVHG